MTNHSEPSWSFKSGWSNIDRTTNPLLYLQLLDQLRPRHADTPEYARFAAMLQVHEGDQILDVGCGAGGGVRAMAQLVGTMGKVTGVDKSEVMIAEACRRSGESRADVEYLVADAHALPFADGTFMGCFADGLFDTVDDPDRALEEMIRVTQQGGRIATWATDDLIIDAPDRDLTRRLVRFVCDHEVNGWLGRALPRMFRERGMIEVTAEPTIELHTHFGVVYKLWLGSFLDHAVQAGAIDAEESTRWCADLLRRSLDGHFLLAWSFFWVAGQKPW